MPSISWYGITLAQDDENLITELNLYLSELPTEGQHLNTLVAAVGGFGDGWRDNGTTVLDHIWARKYMVTYIYI